MKKLSQAVRTGLPAIRVAVLGDSATRFLAQALRGTGMDRGFDLIMWEAEFDQIEIQVFDPASELHAFKPEIVIIFHSSHKLALRHAKLTAEQGIGLAEARLELLERLYAAVNDGLRAKLVYYNYPEIDDSVFGGQAGKVESSLLFQLRKLNVELMRLASRSSGLFLCDLSSIQNRVGKGACIRPSLYVHADMALSLDVLPEVAARTLDIIGAMHGRIRKCLVLDLDNTLWGGVIGDDGLENIELGGLGIGKAFTEFQSWIKKLKNRGILLAVCSKNSEAAAREPFEKHPDMILRLEDIAVFIANWENKADNIRRIRDVLNIDFDAMVFLDDSPFERGMVRESIPGITVPELPEDPADYLEHLYALNLFETASFSREDAGRTALYRVEAHRRAAQAGFADEEGFLESLGMLSLVEPFSGFNAPRVAQLSQRSNQFNLRTVRYGVAEIEAVAAADDRFSFAFTLEDKFGDHGLICAVILKRERESGLFIEAWFMSCRVLQRGMEGFVLNTLAAFARDGGFAHLRGEYLPTSKNAMVKDHFLRLGFARQDEHWMLGVRDYEDRKCFIGTKDGSIKSG